MQPKLSEGVPGCEFEEEIEDNAVVRLREESVKDGNRALSRMRVSIGKQELSTHTPEGCLQSLVQQASTGRIRWH